MKISRIKVKNFMGIKQLELDGSNYELTGTNGAGKSSFLDALRKILTNDTSRDIVVRQGEDESELLLETDTGLKVNRKIRVDKSNFFKVTENEKQINSPQSFLNDIFTPLQLDPVGFTRMDRKEKNRVLLELIQYDWDMNWISEQFGEIPKGVNYEQHILQVLNDIQADGGEYYKNRQIINSKALHLRKTVEDIAAVIPQGYDVEKWENYSLKSNYEELAKIQAENAKIEKCVMFKSNYDDKLRGFEATKQIAIASERKAVSFEREGLLTDIERWKSEIKAAEDKIKGLDDKLSDKIKIAETEYLAEVAKLSSDLDVANKYAGKVKTDVVPLQSEINNAEKMKEHLNEYRRMMQTKAEHETLVEQSEELTRKIELARELPSAILQTSTLPIDNLTVVNGEPLVNGLPVCNLSDGEQLQLCVDVALAKPSGLQVILIDGTENLSTDNRNALYKKCKEKGLQFIASRTTDENELTITEL